MNFWAVIQLIPIIPVVPPLTKLFSSIVGSLQKAIATHGSPDSSTKISFRELMSYFVMRV